MTTPTTPTPEAPDPDGAGALADLFDRARDLATRPGTRRPSGVEWR